MLLILACSAAACSESASPVRPDPVPGPLALTCPASLELPLDDGAELPVTYAAPTALGGQAPVSVTCGPASGSLFAPGTSTVTCTAADAGGQQTSCAFGVTVTRTPRLTVTTFLAFGDSVTEGKLSRVNLLIDSPPHSYPALLTRLLEERYPRQAVRVLNDGWGGERAASDEGISRRRLVEAIRAHRPGAILLMHGTNDLIGDGAPGVGKAADGLEDLVKIAVASAPTFLATLPPLGPKASCQDECVIPYNERIRHLAGAKGAVLVDVHRAWAGRPGLMGADGIHPTAEGYEVIAAAFFEAIRAVLEAENAPR